MIVTSVDRQHILGLYAYHHWATDRMLDATAALTVEQLDREWGGSFRTGRALMRHVVGVEWLWCQRWNGRSPKALPEYSASMAGDDYRGEWERVKSTQRQFLIGLTPDGLAGALSYVNIKGEPWTYPLADILVHVVNHGTYHRGQLTHLLRDRGHAAPSTDYLVFVDEQRKRA